MPENNASPPQQTPASPLVLGVLASGRGSNFQSIIDALASGKLDAKIGILISNKKGAQVLDRAKRHGIPSLFIDPTRYSDRGHYDAELAEVLQAHQVDLVVLAGYMRLITSRLIDHYRNRMINIHPSLLPAFPGLHAHRQALAYGVRLSGCTVHFVDEEMDHGPIILQSMVPVLENDTEDTLSERILREEHRLLPEVIQLYGNRRLRIDGRRVYIFPESRKEGEPLQMKSPL